MDLEGSILIAAPNMRIDLIGINIRRPVIYIAKEEDGHFIAIVINNNGKMITRDDAAIAGSHYLAAGGHRCTDTTYRVFNLRIAERLSWTDGNFYRLRANNELFGDTELAAYQRKARFACEESIYVHGHLKIPKEGLTKNLEQRWFVAGVRSGTTIRIDDLRWSTLWNARGFNIDHFGSVQGRLNYC